MLDRNWGQSPIVAFPKMTAPAPRSFFATVDSRETVAPTRAYDPAARVSYYLLKSLDCAICII